MGAAGMVLAVLVDPAVMYYFEVVALFGILSVAPLTRVARTQRSGRSPSSLTVTSVRKLMFQMRPPLAWRKVEPPRPCAPRAALESHAHARWGRGR